MAPEQQPKPEEKPSEPLPKKLPDELKKEIDEAKSHIESKIEKSGKTERIKLMQCQAEQILMDPINLHVEKYLAAKTIPEREQVQKELMSHLAFMKAVVDAVCPEGVRMKAEHLQRIIDYGKILSDPNRSKEMQDALRWVMGIPLEGTSSVDAKESEKAKKTLMESLGKDENDPSFAYACTMITMLDHDKKMEVVKGFLTKEMGLNPSEPFDVSADPEKSSKAKKLLAKLNKLGAISPIEIEELVGAQNVTEEERYEYAKGWDAKNNLMALNKFMMEESYGARNDFDKMFNFKNILLLVGMVAGGATVLANIFVNLKAGGNWRKPTEYAKLITHPYIVGGALVAGASKIGMSSGGMDGFLADKQRESETYATMDFRTNLNASPGFRKFFESDNHKGLQVLADYVNSFSKEDQKKRPITLKMFREHLSKKKSEPGYEALLAQLDSMSQHEQEKENMSDRFESFAKGIHVLNIGGTSAIDTYKDILAGKKIIVHKS